MADCTKEYSPFIAEHIKQQEPDMVQVNRYDLEVLWDLAYERQQMYDTTTYADIAQYRYNQDVIDRIKAALEQK